MLPNEPRVENWRKQNALTLRFLMPARENVEALFLSLRAHLDPILSNLRPVKHDKPYPLGQCLEISRAVERLLPQIDRRTLTAPAARGHAALSTFHRHGGVVRQVWGDLRGEYFQNAFLAGTLYIDVSNDTVVSTKPKVEILPLEQARFTPVLDYAHFARIAARYWKAAVFPNHVVPELAPYFPLVLVSPTEGVKLQCPSGYMTTLTRREGFCPSEVALDRAPIDDELFRTIRGCIDSSALETPASVQHGRSQAIQACRDFRVRGWHRSDDRCRAAVTRLLDVNRQLSRLRVNPSHERADLASATMTA